MVTSNNSDGYDSYDRPCSYHPNVTTRLRCSRCEKPICPRCMVPSPVGYRCPDCARGPKPVLYQTSAVGIATAALAGVLVAAAVGIVWGRFPTWEFYCALALGFGVAEAMAWVTGYKRGRELQVTAIVCVIIGLIVSKLAIAGFSDFLTVDMLLNESTNGAVAEAFQLELLPDFLFMAIPFVIVSIRFR